MVDLHPEGAFGCSGRVMLPPAGLQKEPCSRMVYRGNKKHNKLEMLHTSE